MTTKTTCDMNNIANKPILELAGNVIEGTTKPGLYMLLPGPTLREDEEERVLGAYISADWTVEEFLNVAFMFACFTLLLNDDDNF